MQFLGVTQRGTLTFLNLYRKLTCPSSSSSTLLATSSSSPHWGNWTDSASHAGLSHAARRVPTPSRKTYSLRSRTEMTRSQFSRQTRSWTNKMKLMRFTRTRRQERDRTWITDQCKATWKWRWLVTSVSSARSLTMATCSILRLSVWNSRNSRIWAYRVRISCRASRRLLRKWPSLTIRILSLSKSLRSHSTLTTSSIQQHLPQLQLPRVLVVPVTVTN